MVNKGQWIRVTGKAVFDQDDSYAEKYLNEVSPGLKYLYNDQTGHRLQKSETTCPKNETTPGWFHFSFSGKCISRNRIKVGSLIEILLTIMSSLAQEKLRSIYQNIVFGQRRRFTG